ncbi:hypothetical protein ACFPT7_01025 [Acidicapsa dinghuensis]|uniref:Uncharacterized protein n=1 Tax=Acidicapsa dinghuensis TaxID=2218256 RepID=A0ABW1E964_9BACT
MRHNRDHRLHFHGKTALLVLVFAVTCLAATSAHAQDPQSTTPDTKPVDTGSSPESQQPTAPDSQKPAQTTAPTPATAPSQQQSPATLPNAPTPAKQNSDDKTNKPNCAKLPCPTEFINWYMRFENGPQVKPLTPKEKAWLATKNVIDPFNAITILGEAGISVAADSHSAVGPGFPGWGRAVGISYTEDITGEFFGTFLIPSIVHQDPHYHRMPQASIKRRIFHAAYQVLWTQGDNGKGMPNYANIIGFGIDDEIANLYVPGRRTNVPASAQRYGIGLATAPIDNYITEFLPDVAKHVHVQIVVVQRIINQVANKDGNGF